MHCSFGGGSGCVSTVAGRQYRGRVLALVHSLTSVLSIGLAICGRPCSGRNNFHRGLNITKRDDHSVSVILGLIVRVLAHPSLSINKRPLVSHAPTSRRRVRHRLFGLHHRLQLGAPKIAPSRHLVSLLGTSPHFYGYGSGFCRTLGKCPGIAGVSMHRLGRGSHGHSNSLRIGQSRFSCFVLHDSSLPAIGSGGTAVRVVSPMLGSDGCQ